MPRINARLKQAPARTINPIHRPAKSSQRFREILSSIANDNSTNPAIACCVQQLRAKSLIIQSPIFAVITDTIIWWAENRKIHDSTRHLRKNMESIAKNYSIPELATLILVRKNLSIHRRYLAPQMTFYPRNCHAFSTVMSGASGFFMPTMW